MNETNDTRTLAEQFRTVMQLREHLGRKFVEADIEREPEKLIADAMWYARIYRGNFEYMLSMQQKVIVAGRLSARQAAGVLNCLVAEVEYRAKHGEPNTAKCTTPAPKPADDKSDFIDGTQVNNVAVKHGTYTVTLADGSYVTLKVEEPGFGNFNPGTMMVSYLSGSDNETDYTGFAFITPENKIRLWKKYSEKDVLIRQKAAMLVLLCAPDPVKFGAAYAEASGRCWRCGRKLTVPSSLHRGLGPECAKLYGVA